MHTVQWIVNCTMQNKLYNTVQAVMFKLYGVV